MKRLPLSLILFSLLMISACSHRMNLASRGESKSSSDSPLDSRIPPPDFTKCSAAGERNPSIFIQPYGIELQTNIDPDVRRISPADLKDALAALPVTAWPHGRILNVQEPSIGSVNDEPLIGQNAAKVEEVLRSLRLARCPSTR